LLLLPACVTTSDVAGKDAVGATLNKSSKLSSGQAEELLLLPLPPLTLLLLEEPLHVDELSPSPTHLPVAARIETAATERNFAEMIVS
jgi:hypothetical protein